MPAGTILYVVERGKNLVLCEYRTKLIGEKLGSREYRSRTDNKATLGKILFNGTAQKENILNTHIILLYRRKILFFIGKNYYYIDTIFGVSWMYSLLLLFQSLLFFA